ncbi:hypothetical protein GMORB2_6529 [Geosmithia morbida]|uniref:WSC domain-containing protein n=1 Tax=Geosmithia morbida TaxID=1094350 RepID=A0A9P4YWG6_9HYPO|nr:uncharacterized protein GMORB2_6529 [Geosmithia morbida]KAF4122981.1 hypothetical protein GMORB2_6529 [Geosmithia morbida]
MASSSQAWVRRAGIAAVIMAASVVLAPVYAVDVSICASFNTASTDRNVSIYQSNGLCTNFCSADYAYAITQKNGCWCSNYIPSESSQVDTDDCDTACPGYPDEMCGGSDLFGYLELDTNSPSGTKGPSAASSTTSEDPETSTREPAKTSTTSDEPATTTAIQTLTSNGEVKTVTVMPTSDSDQSSDSSDSDKDKSGGGLGTGGVVGIVVGVVGVILIAAAAVLFWLFKRRRDQQAGYNNDPSVHGSSMLGSAHPEMSSSPTSNRNSVLAIDPRMDPFKQGLYMRNGSQESIGTIRDEHDYSRRIQPPKVLRATNPDPEDAN